MAATDLIENLWPEVVEELAQDVRRWPITNDLPGELYLELITAPDLIHTDELEDGRVYCTASLGIRYVASGKWHLLQEVQVSDRVIEELYTNRVLSSVFHLLPIATENMITTIETSLAGNSRVQVGYNRVDSFTPEASSGLSTEIVLAVTFLVTNATYTR